MTNILQNDGEAIKVGDRVRTLYQHSETAKIVEPTKASLPLPGPDWFVIRFDSDGKRLCAHRSMLAAI